MDGRSKRRLSFPADHEAAEPLTCTLCNGRHINTSAPEDWRNSQAKQYATTLSLRPSSPVCRPCKDDIVCILKDSTITPRWKKKSGVSPCCISECDTPAVRFSKCITFQNITDLGREVSTELITTNSTPLCLEHYDQIYREMNSPKQTHCSYCEVNLRNTIVRKSKEGTKVCYCCYRLELQEWSNRASTDEELSQLIFSLRESLTKFNSTNLSVNDVINSAMQHACVAVGKCILAQESILLPQVHTLFVRAVQNLLDEGSDIGDRDVNTLVTARWILNSLKCTFQHHLDTACKIKRHGTILYRRGGDILMSLSKALHNASTSKHDTQPSVRTNDEATKESTLFESAKTINQILRKEIGESLKLKKDKSFTFDAVNFDQLIEKTDSTVWTFICELTKSTSEVRGTSKGNDPHSTSHHVKRVRRLFCTCLLRYIIDDRCNFPLHNLIADAVDAYGGSSVLIKLMNRLGLCSSETKLRKFIQHIVTEREKIGPERELDMNSLIYKSSRGRTVQNCLHESIGCYSQSKGHSYSYLT